MRAPTSLVHAAKKWPFYANLTGELASTDISMMQFSLPLLSKSMAHFSWYRSHQISESLVSVRLAYGSPVNERRTRDVIGSVLEVISVFCHR